MDEVGKVPSRTKSKHKRSSIAKDVPLHQSERERLQKKPSTSSSSTPRSTATTTTFKSTPRGTSASASTSTSTRPSLTTRTASAPLVPTLRDPKYQVIGFDPDDETQRNSITSIKDDPFFRNYQTPQSVSLARELRTATYTESLRDEDILSETLRSANKPSMEDSMKLPVCLHSRNGGSRIDNLSSLNREAECLI